jgi:hypothetical protein
MVNQESRLGSTFALGPSDLRTFTAPNHGSVFGDVASSVVDRYLANCF